MSNFTDIFVEMNEGKTFGFPFGKYVGECLSLAKVYIQDRYEIYPPASGCNGARCYWSNFPDPLGTVLKKVKNTPNLIPKKGWIAVWNGNVGDESGHIDIVLEANTNTFVGFDQNWEGRNAHKVTHNYDNIYGFLVPINDEEIPESESMLLEYLGMPNEKEAIERLKKHLGGDVKCEWGNANSNSGGHLGSARREITTLRETVKELESQQIKPSIPSGNDNIELPILNSNFELESVTYKKK